MRLIDADALRDCAVEVEIPLTDSGLTLRGSYINREVLDAAPTVGPELTAHLYRGRPIAVTKESIDLLMAEIDRLKAEDTATKR